MEEPLDADSRTREYLVHTYDDVISFFEEEQNIPAKLNNEISRKYGPNILKDLRQKRRELSDPFYVVVSGEISAGKSSLLNLLIGKDVLPASPLKCTSVTCRLRHSDHTYAELVCNNQEKQTFYFNENKDELEDLQNIIKGKKVIENVCHIDIMVREDILKGNIVLVDTPGIAEDSTDDNTILTECLKKACAFIYVIKSDSNGGTHQLFRILEHVADLQCNRQTDLDPRCIMYVCNKWDLVEGSEDEVFTEIKKRLKDKHIPTKDNQFNLLSAKKEMKRRRKGQEHSQNYLQFKQRLKAVISYAAKNKLRYCSDWIERMCHDMKTFIELYLNNISKDLIERKEMKSKAEMEVHLIQEMLEKPKVNIVNEAINIYTKLSVQLEDFLRTDDVKQKCVETVIAQITNPNLDSYQEIEINCKNICHQDINSRIRNWCFQKQPENACNDLKEKIIASLHEIEVELENTVLVQSSHAEARAQAPVNKPSQDDTDDTQKTDDELFSSKEKLGLTMTFPLWFPVALTAGVFVVPIGLGAMAAQKVMDKNAVKDFYLHPEQKVSQILDDILKEERYSKDFFFEHFEKSYVRLFVQWIAENEINKRKDLESKLRQIDVLDKDIPLTDKEKTKFSFCKETIDKINDNYNLLKNC